VQNLAGNGCSANARTDGRDGGVWSTSLPVSLMAGRPSDAAAVLVFSPGGFEDQASSGNAWQARNVAPLPNTPDREGPGRQP